MSASVPEEKVSEDIRKKQGKKYEANDQHFSSKLFLRISAIRLTYQDEAEYDNTAKTHPASQRKKRRSKQHTNGMVSRFDNGGH